MVSAVLRRLLAEWFLLALALCALVAGAAHLGALDRADAFAYDRLLPLVEREADARVVIVKIDDPSLANLGAWPWKRSVHGELFDRLATAAPKAVLFDVIITEPSVDAREDAAMTTAMAKLPRVVAPVLLTNNFAGGLHASMPIPQLSEVSKLGTIAVLPDDDGVVRSVDLSQTDDAGVRWPLMTTLLDDSLPQSGVLRVPFNVPEGSYVSFSVSDVLAGNVPADFLKDKYVLIGATATGLGDRYPTPNAGIRSTLPGIEIHANVLDALLNGLSVQRVDAVWVAVLPVLLLLGCLLLLRERFHLWIFVGLTVSYVIFVMAALWLHLIWLPPSASVLGLIAAYVLWSWRRMAVILGHVRGELISWRSQTGAVAELLPHPPSSALTPHSLELDMTRAHHLSEFVTSSLQQLPVAVLLLDASGKVLMHNKMAQAVLTQQILIGSLAQELLDMPSLAVADLDNCEFNTKAGVYQLHVVALTFKSAEGYVVWQISLIDLSNERAAQRQRGELMAFLSHDLRVPQVGILSLLEMHRAANSTLSTEKLLEGVGEKAQKTLDAANDLVHLAQAQDGQYNMQEVNLVTLIQSATNQIRAQAGAKKISLALNRSMDELFDSTWTLGDAGMLTRALMNLLTNAIRYSPSNTAVDVSLNLHDLHASCTINDQGQGMEPAQVAQLNQMMASGIAATHMPKLKSDAAGSLGVGLHMVATVVRHHGGSVVFASAGLNAGTTVKVTLPVLPADDLLL